MIALVADSVLVLPETSGALRRELIIIFFLFLPLAGFSQNLDNLMTKRPVDCSDISYSCSFYFQKYMEEDKVDSVKNILEYWENKCGVREPLFRAKILLSLKMGNFNDSLLSHGSLNYILNYQERMKIINDASFYAFEDRKSYFGFIPPGQEFDNYTHDLAASLIEKYKPGAIEFILCEFYSGNSDTIFSKIQTAQYTNTSLRREYNEAVEMYYKMSEFHVSWITGLWIPTGDLKKLGVHPELGFQMGAKIKKMNYDGVMTVKFVKTPDYYYARRPGQALEPTNTFFGAHIGFDIGRDLYARNGHEVQLTGGIAIDGFDVFPAEYYPYYNSISTLSYNFSFGLGYRYYLAHEKYLGIRVKYNIVDYSLNNVIDFTGNPVTIQFIIGFLNNLYRNNNLRKLKYKLRK